MVGNDGSKQEPTKITGRFTKNIIKNANYICEVTPSSCPP